MFGKRKARHLSLGERGERLACWYLRVRGYRIVDRNYLCPSGEIDIVARKGGILIFVEVRTRRRGFLEDPILFIRDIKLAHFMDAAHHYLLTRRKLEAPCRFDIITVVGSGTIGSRVTHYLDAFYTTDERPVRGRRLKTWVRRQPRPGGRNRPD